MQQEWLKVFVREIDSPIDRSSSTRRVTANRFTLESNTLETGSSTISTTASTIINYILESRRITGQVSRDGIMRSYAIRIIDWWYSLRFSMTGLGTSSSAGSVHPPLLGRISLLRNKHLSFSLSAYVLNRLALTLVRLGWWASLLLDL